jgi:hypothetical protein
MTTPSTTYRTYRAWELALLTIATVAGLALSPRDIGGFCTLLAWGYAFIRDWRGVWSLRGIIPYRRIPLMLRVALVLVLTALLPLAFPVYVGRAAYDAWTWKRGEPARIRARIAQLEHELGISQERTR